MPNLNVNTNNGTYDIFEGEPPFKKSKLLQASYTTFHQTSCGTTYYFSDIILNGGDIEPKARPCEKFLEKFPKNCQTVKCPVGLYLWISKKYPI